MRTTVRLLPPCLVALAAVLAALHAWSTAWTCDDAFISFRYAQNLVDGNGLVFNIGERVEGYTNFSWTMLCAGAIALGFDPVLDQYLEGIATSPVDQVRADHAAFRDYYFRHNQDPLRERPFLDRLGS